MQFFKASEMSQKVNGMFIFLGFMNVLLLLFVICVYTIVIFSVLIYCHYLSIDTMNQCIFDLNLETTLNIVS